MPHRLGHPQHRLAVGIDGADRIFGQDVAHHFDQHTNIHRLGQIVFSTQFQQSNGTVNGTVTGHENIGRQLDASGAHFLKQTFTINVWQLDVADHHTKLLFHQRCTRRLAGLEPGAVQPFNLKAVRYRFTHDLVVFNQTNAIRTHASFVLSNGKVTENLTRPFSWLKSILPPSCCTIW